MGAILSQSFLTDHKLHPFFWMLKPRNQHLNSSAHSPSRRSSILWQQGLICHGPCAFSLSPLCPRNYLVFRLTSSLPDLSLVLPGSQDSFPVGYTACEFIRPFLWEIFCLSLKLPLFVCCRLQKDLNLMVLLAPPSTAYSQTDVKASGCWTPSDYPLLDQRLSLCIQRVRSCVSITFINMQNLKAQCTKNITIHGFLDFQQKTRSCNIVKRFCSTEESFQSFP